MMDKTSHYSTYAAVLTTIGLTLSISKPPFYLDIIIIGVALVYAFIANHKGEE